jgi:peptidoglycan/LPS O-acetylase OafA/YrhL
MGPMAIVWSLAIEEQFYFVWPLALSLALKFGASRRVIIITLLAGIMAVVVNRSLLLADGARVIRLYYATDTRADALLIGCLTALLLSWDLIPQRDFARRLLTVMAALSLVFIGFLVATSNWDNPNLYRGFLTLVSLGIATCLIVLMLWPPAAVLVVLRFAPLRWLGRISYGLYLWHWPMREYLCPQIHRCSTTGKLAIAALAFFFTIISYYCVERPFLRLKERLAAA